MVDNKASLMLAFCLPDKYITMNKQNLNQALAALADALTSDDVSQYKIDPLVFVKQLPWRSLSGDHINGGKILNFSSAGITDQAATEQIKLTNEGVNISALTVGSVKGSLTVENEVVAKTVRVDVLEAKEIKADIQFEKDTPVVFAGSDVFGKGLLWQGHGYTKQFVFNNGPERFFSSEIIDIGAGKHLSVNGNKVLSETELGPTVVSSSLRQVGRLKGLLVDGSVSIDQYIVYSSDTNRLGIGTDAPHAALSIMEDFVEIVLGSRGENKAGAGTFTSNDFELVTDDTARLTLKANGNIELGNKNTLPIQVSVFGTLGVNVNNPDPRVKLHVNGAVKFNDKLQMSGTGIPDNGSYNQGDIVWNSEPSVNRSIGWVCIRAGTPGIWSPFGRIEESV